MIRRRFEREEILVTAALLTGIRRLHQMQAAFQAFAKIDF
jgi:hypothetical protein